MTAPSGFAFVFAGVLAMAVAPSALGAQLSGLPALMAGVYKTKFKNGLVGGESYVSENILEIVPVRGRAVYFRIHLEFYNGHECAISGIAEASVDTLIYRGPDDVDNHPCVLSLRRTRDGVHISTCRAFRPRTNIQRPSRNMTPVPADPPTLHRIDLGWSVPMFRTPGTSISSAHFSRRMIRCPLRFKA